MDELDIAHASGKFAKTKFSMVLPEVEEQLKTLCSSDVKHIVLFGIEVRCLLIGCNWAASDLYFSYIHHKKILLKVEPLLKQA